MSRGQFEASLEILDDLETIYRNIGSDLSKYLDLRPETEAELNEHREKVIARFERGGASARCKTAADVLEAAKFFAGEIDRMKTRLDQLISEQSKLDSTSFEELVDLVVPVFEQNHKMLKAPNKIDREHVIEFYLGRDRGSRDTGRDRGRGRR